MCIYRVRNSRISHPYRLGTYAHLFCARTTRRRRRQRRQPSNTARSKQVQFTKAIDQHAALQANILDWIGKRAQCLLAYSRAQNYVSHANTYVDEEVFLQNLPSIKAPLTPYSTELHRKTETPVRRLKNTHSV